MAEPFLSEIRLFSFAFAPRGWALCNGQQLPINQNQGLFSLLSTTYGGNGLTTFALPDLRGRVPIHVGSGHTLGGRGGAASHTLSLAELPLHAHVVRASNVPATSGTPDGTMLLSNSLGSALYGPPSNPTALAPASVVNAGGTQAHQNMQPFLAISFCIALQGAFPSAT